MRGCTPHFVLGLMHSIVFGRHFYAMCCIQRSCHGLVHTLVMGYGITNIFHDDGTRWMIRQLMALWYRHFILRCGFDGTLSSRSGEAKANSIYLTVEDAHVPDMRTQDGLLDVIAVGCVLEFTTALSRSRYHPSYDPNTDEARALRVQENQGREWFRVVMKVFGAKYQIFTNNNIVPVATIWQSALVRFAVAVVWHMHERRDSDPTAPGVTLEAVADALRLHLHEDHPHLVPAFEAGINGAPMTFLSWPTGQYPLEVVPKRPSYRHLLLALGMPEQREIPQANLPLHPDECGLVARKAVNGYYAGVWPGQDLPNDEF